MEMDLQQDEREFIANAIESYLEAFPEYQEFADHFLDLLSYCQKVGTTLHIN